MNSIFVCAGDSNFAQIFIGNCTLIDFNVDRAVLSGCGDSSIPLELEKLQISILGLVKINERLDRVLYQIALDFRINHWIVSISAHFALKEGEFGTVNVQYVVLKIHSRSINYLI